MAERKRIRTNWATDLGNGMTKIEGNCVFTGKEHSIEVPTAGLLRWLGGDSVQVAMPNVSADDREFLISGISPEGWKETFGE